MSDTIREHYIPQFYFKNFSPDKIRIFQYQLDSNLPSKLVPIESICYKKNLYEFRDNDGKILHKNLIEDCFARLEKNFSEAIKSIESKSRIEENFYSPCFLSNDEKISLVIFVSTLILRSPQALNAAKEGAIDFFEELNYSISENSAFNLALDRCLPLYRIEDDQSKNILSLYIEKLADMSFQIGVANNNKIFSSDDPVIISGDSKNMQIDKILLPLTSSVILLMKQFKQTEKNFRNRLVYLDSDDVKLINDKTITHCQNWIYSQNEITNKQIRHIEKMKGTHL